MALRITSYPFAIPTPRQIARMRGTTAGKKHKTTLDILSVINEHPGVQPPELARQLEIGESTVRSTFTELKKGTGYPQEFHSLWEGEDPEELGITVESIITLTRRIQADTLEQYVDKLRRRLYSFFVGYPVVVLSVSMSDPDEPGTHFGFAQISPFSESRYARGNESEHPRSTLYTGPFETEHQQSWVLGLARSTGYSAPAFPHMVYRKVPGRDGRPNASIALFFEADSVTSWRSAEATIGFITDIVGARIEMATYRYGRKVTHDSPPEKLRKNFAERGLNDIESAIAIQYVFGATYAQLAEQYSMTPNGVGKMLTRIRNDLKISSLQKYAFLEVFGWQIGFGTNERPEDDG